MGGNATFRKSGKRVLVVGKLGYHEQTVVGPILDQLRLLGASIYRLGGSMDFFVAENQEEMIWNWVKAPLVSDLSKYEIVFFVDYWNMSLPLFLYKKGVENPAIRLVGLCHGTVRLPEDVALSVPKSVEYEEFLKLSYDTILVHDYWLKELMGGSDYTSLHVAGLPLDLEINRRRPEFPANNRVIYAHRFEPDKGRQQFIDFVSRCREDRNLYVRSTEFIVTADQEDVLKYDLGINFVGRLSQWDLRKLCCDGGYAWSSAKSELAAYAVHDLCSYGLTPLLNKHKAYDHFPEEFRYSNLSEAVNVIRHCRTLSNDDWYKILEPMKDNSKRLAEVIYGSVS